MPSWITNAVFYEIYPQSFQDSNADGIGDIPGIISRLDYIRDLGCDALWINPCFESPFMDAGYDVSDYRRVAPRYGTNDDLAGLFRAAHARGMRVILDLVPGHTSIEHPWFSESKKAESNELSHRYIWTDSVWKGIENVSSVSGSLRGISDRDGSCALNFFTTQPALNYGFAAPSEPWQLSFRSPEALATREAMKDVMRFWLAMGCDGFRVDMAGSLVKNDPGQEATIELWRDFRSFLDRDYPEAAIISEWGEPDKSLRGGFHMDFLLHFGPSHYLDLFRAESPYFSRKGCGDLSSFVAHYREIYEKTDGKGLICVPSGNHDMARIAGKLDERELKLAFAFLLSLPGAPFIYYGDEIGMRYQAGLTSKEGGYERTGSRTPMQWDSRAVNAGFSNAPPDRLYLPIDPSNDRPTVDRARNRDDSLFAEIRRLIALRRAHASLGGAARISFVCDGKAGGPLAFIRESDAERVLVAFNPGTKKATVPIERLGRVDAAFYSLGGGGAPRGDALLLEPESAAFFSLR